MASAAESFSPLITGIPASRDDWELEDAVTVPESPVHDRICLLLQLVFLAWVERTRNGAFIVRNAAFRWDQGKPRIGVDPDVAILAAPPPDWERVRSLRTWIEGHTPPLLAIEVVSMNHPWKDYDIQQRKHAANGTGELWVFDPLLEGPKGTGGPFVLQVWARRSDGAFERVHAGDAPFRSPKLGAWIVTTEEGMRLRVADDAEGTNLWLTGEEQALAEVIALRAELARLTK